MDPEHSSSADGYVYPFTTLAPSAARQTGGDWYRLALSASLGGKAIHGINLTPACETITKVSEEHAAKYVTGRIKFSPEERLIPAMGTDITERPYQNKDYKGTRSGTSAFFSFDQAMWEPSSRKRARDAALLAAAIASHTGDKSEACTIVSRIASDEISEEAIEVANIPVSHLRRDIIAVSKPSHKVFSCGTIQRSIIWDDNQMTTEKLEPTAAVDWGRITTIARYIGEANLQVDTKFAAYARDYGVPYDFVRGAWAYAAFGDFVLDASKFIAVPAVDITLYGVPSLRGAYNHAADSILRQCYVNLNRLSYEEAAPDAMKLLEIIDKCKMRIRGSAPARVTWTETDVLAGPSRHSIDAREGARATAESSTAWKALIEAFSAKVSANSTLLTIATEVAARAKLSKPAMERTDCLTKGALSSDVWTNARDILAVACGSQERAERLMAKKLRSTFRTSASFGTWTTVPNAWLVPARGTTIALAKALIIEPAPKPPKFNPYTTARAMVGAQAMKQAASTALHLITSFKQEWAARYRSWARTISVLGHDVAGQDIFNYKMAAIAFETVTVHTILAISARFMEGDNPYSSYVYRTAKEYCAEKNLRLPTLASMTYTSSQELAAELDGIDNLDVSFVVAEDWVYSRLCMLAGDFGVSSGGVLSAEEKEFEETRKRLAGGVTKVGRLVMRGGADLNSRISRLSGLLGITRPAATTVTYHSVLASYGSEQVAEAHAIANGYGSFAEAYEALGIGARYDDEGAYTKAGITAASAEATSRDDGMILG